MASVAVGGPYFVATQVLPLPPFSRLQLIALLALALWAFSEGALLRSNQSQQQDMTRHWLPRLTMALIAVALPLALIESRAQFVSMRWLGIPISLMLIGIALRVLAIRTLQDWFYDGVIVTDQQQLVTTGIYAYFRHPSEIGLLCFLFGYALLLQAWISLLLVGAIILPLSIYRCRQEDALLQQHFGEEFDIYRHKTLI